MSETTDRNTSPIEEREISRRSFLAGSSALVLGLAAAGGRSRFYFGRAYGE